MLSFILALLSGCATTSEDAGAGAMNDKPSDLAEKIRRQMGATPRLATTPIVATAEPGQNKTKIRIFHGSGNFLNSQARNEATSAQPHEGDITLNFELADIRDVIKVVFDTLQENYVLDPGVQGEVTIQTSRPLSKDQLLPTLENLLRMNGAALVRTGGVYKIVPAAGALPGNGPPHLNNSRLGPGYSVRIFPLRYISATEMQTILQPFAPEGGIVLVDPVRNLIMLAGTQQELNYLQETVDLFDVNWLKGMSVGMYTLKNIDAQEMATELDKLFGPNSQLPLAGMFRFIPIGRLNALLVITPQSEFLTDVTAWVERLDGGGGERLYVYEVQNSDAEYLSGLLNQVFGDSVTTGSAASNSGRVAPGLQPGQISSGTSRPGTTGSSSSSGLSSGGLSKSAALLTEEEDAVLQAQAVNQPQYRPPAQPVQQPTRAPAAVGGNRGVAAGVPPTAAARPSGPGGTSGGTGPGLNDKPRIIADTENNALLIWAGPQSYEKIQDALRRMDVPKRQVLIEATIAEVSLTDDLEYGLQWFFKNSVDGHTGIGSLNLNINKPVTDLLGSGFSYAITDAGGIVRALLDTLAQESKVRVLSSPQIMVIDNQQAKIRVGDQQPVRSSTTTTEGGNTTASIEYKDTGVLLDVKPQLNAGGLVTLDIDQEVTDVGNIDTATGQRAFTQRTINSKVAVKSGQTIVLGGLIRDTARDGKGGVPGLYKIPIFGALFGTTTNNKTRTELVVLITPRLIQNSDEAVQVTNELRERMRGVIPLESPWKNKPKLKK